MIIWRNLFSERSYAAHQAHGGPHSAGKDGEDGAFRRRGPRKSFADECDRPDAVAGDGPQELPAQAE